MSEADHTAFEQDFSDYYDELLPAARAAEVKAHLDGCERCRAEYGKFEDTMRSVSGLLKVPAPQDFPKQVETTIHKRSAGRFFGRRAFGDRVPFELLAVVGLLLAAGVFLLLRY